MSRARLIPAIDVLLGLPAAGPLAERHGARAFRAALEAAVARVRAALLAGDDETDSRDAVAARILEATATALDAAARPSLRAAINATGVVIHTNLGRAPLARTALDAMAAVAAGYSTLEYDIVTGGRGSRHLHLDALLAEATGAAAGVATNNTAAGLTLALAAIAAGREVIISRGELVEIGGGFRVPDILRGSGALLREVGTTNRTRVADYAAAITDRTAAILRVHPSNFRMEGFTARPSLGELSGVARGLGVPVIEDQGSGWLGFDLFPDGTFPPEARAVLAHEPAVRESIRDGADVVAFSGDKLLGGPQAGLLVGRADLLACIRKHPLMRAVRVDKVTYAGLDATLRAFLAGRAGREVPVMRMLALSDEALETRARVLARRLDEAGVACETAAGLSTIGGGSTPGATLPTTLVRLRTSSPDALAAALRRGDPPVIARVHDGAVCLDPRTIGEAEEDALVQAVSTARGRRAVPS
ncbi:L-seryl-tRNA(Sec) selenium transferase [Luteitalea sp. TBR-22]|uniref:L-seryl-tRNA(Sec) selenium transferase n=1 Tax=Luteitalea sp. TBR-22 TaxID=2802971 RepID=UPI001AF7AD30|nr:L-seryl-tRNA(Sec) selenium transferase [Luteitalea sp. TBR-22]BCS34658.1 L-seryl-tRNA(Sec) selenium transferase [Luteitalea sp. TBR-22]